MPAWEFVYTIRGTGANESEALTDALNAFEEDPGEPDTATLVEDDD